MLPRRTCPACARRYAQLVAPDCPVCQGLGVLNLGPAATAHHTPAAVSRAVELYLEDTSRRTREELPLGQHRDALELAVDDLRLAGVLASPHDPAGPAEHPPAPRDRDAVRATELDAYRVARTVLATPVSVAAVTALAAPPVDQLEQLRPRDGRPPSGSAAGSRSALATIADPIDPLGEDTAVIEATRYADSHAARVLSAATPHAARRKAHP
jgi:hypothetical protein